jgi:protoheme IX farnesyltransferase
MNKKTLRAYYQLTKPGIIKGNLVSATAGFLLASNGTIEFLQLLYALIGIAFVIGSGCVVNNYIDIDIDRKMKRTNKRSLVTGEISGQSALIYAAVLGIIGLGVLGALVNYLTMFVGVAGFIFYVAVYGYFKRKSVHGTLVGSISGSLPPVAGYVAVTGTIDLGAVLLFVTLAAWQMPHFFAIAMYRSQDYKDASLPVLPVVKGAKSTINQIIIYIILFITASMLLSVYGYTGWTYTIIVFGIGLWWLSIGLKGLKVSSKDTDKWARNVFKSSLFVLIIFSVMISINSLVP